MWLETEEPKRFTWDTILDLCKLLKALAFL